MNVTAVGESVADVNCVGPGEGLPEGWRLVRFRDVCGINPPKPAKDALAPGASVTFVPMPAVDADSGTIASPSIRPFSEVRGGFTAFRDGDVIFAKITPCMENGKVAIARGLMNGLGFGSSEFHVLRPTNVVLSEYVYHYLRQESFRRAAQDNMTGSVGQLRVPSEFIAESTLPLPPLDEQKRIVNLVESLLQQVVHAKRRTQNAVAILKHFRQSVLAAACSGRLTADWREANQGTAVAVGVNPVNSQGGSAPDSWIRTSLGSLSSHVTSGSRDWTKYYGRGDATFIMAQNVRPGRLDLTHHQAVDPPIGSKDTDRTRVERGDLLITIVGANTGDVCPVTVELPEHYVCQSVAIVRPISSDLTLYLDLFLNSEQHGRLQFSEFLYGAGRPHLSFDQIKMTTVDLPTHAEQLEIVRRADALFRRADEIQVRVEVASARLDKLTQAILAKAFRGELVPTGAELANGEEQDFEPATVLLETQGVGR